MHDVSGKLYLGSGAFSHVYSVKPSDAKNYDAVIVKVPDSVAAVKSLENELKILRTLQNESIPSLYEDYLYLQVLWLEQRDVHSLFKCLPLRAHAGRNALDELLHLTLQDDRLSLVKVVAAGIKKVVDYDHAMAWFIWTFSLLASLLVAMPQHTVSFRCR